VSNSLLGVCCSEANVRTSAKQPGQEAYKPLQFFRKLRHEKNYITFKVNAIIQSP